MTCVVSDGHHRRTERTKRGGSKMSARGCPPASARLRPVVGRAWSRFRPLVGSPSAGERYGRVRRTDAASHPSAGTDERSNRLPSTPVSPLPALGGRDEGSYRSGIHLLGSGPAFEPKPRPTRSKRPPAPMNAPTVSLRHRYQLFPRFVGRDEGSDWRATIDREASRPRIRSPLRG